MEVLDQFQFLRPLWFLALIPAVGVIVLLLLTQFRGSAWEQHIDDRLLPFLLVAPEKARSRLPLGILLLAWILGIVAIAGPVWEKKPQPVHERENALVIIFDVTRSMYATDVSPNRLVRARRKVLDLLSRRSEGVTALVVFSGDANVVTPLTDDANTVAALIPSLSPDIMRNIETGVAWAPGSRLAPALELAMRLFKDAGAASGRILVVTDEIRDLAESQAIARENRFSYPVSVLSVGTSEGAPVPLAGDAGYLKDSSGVLVIPRVNHESLSDFAQVSGGKFARMTLADEDIDYLLAEDLANSLDEFRLLERDFDVWFEEGPWLLLVLLPLAALAFRRGWVWTLPVLLIINPQTADASWWDDLWQTRDQQAMQAIAAGDPATAAGLFENSQWRGTAQYQAGEFEAAAGNFDTGGGSDDRYNLGNALAKQQLFEPAIQAYEDALTLNPDNEDAAFNKALVEELLKQQQEQQESEQDQDQEGEDQNEQAENQPSEESDQQQEEPQEGEEQQQADEQQMAQSEEEISEEEQQQAVEQWLRRVPDDPGGLLRRKFQIQHEDRINTGQVTRNDADVDW